MDTFKECSGIKKEGESCSRNNKCTYPNCTETVETPSIPKMYTKDEVYSLCLRAYCKGGVHEHTDQTFDDCIKSIL